MMKLHFALAIVCLLHANSAAASSAPQFAPELRCAHPELLLIEHSVGDLDTAYRALCKKEIGSQRGWYTGEAARDFGCLKRDYIRNAIFAAYGKPFRSSRWRTTFATAAWYSEVKDFSSSSLSLQAWENVSALKDCYTRQELRDRTTLERWLELLHTKQFVKAGEMMHFPFYLAVDDKGNGPCFRFEKVSTRLTQCLSFWLVREKPEDRFRATRPWRAYYFSGEVDRPRAADWELRPLDDAAWQQRGESGPIEGVTIIGHRSVSIDLHPPDLACQMGVDPQFTERMEDGDCGSWSAVIEILLSEEGRILAAQARGPAD